VVDHPSEETLKRFAAGSSPREESRAVVAHLLKGCSLCVGTLRGLMQPAAVAVRSYERPLSRFDRNLLGQLESDVDREPALATVLRGMARHRSLGGEMKKK
jgi:hypothetical protein